MRCSRHQLGKLILGPDAELAASFFHKLRAQGISLDELHSKLLGPTAAHLGDLWDLDRIDFVDVTLGVARLQRLVITFEGLDEVLAGEVRKSIMIVGAPGEQHSLGNSIIQRFFRAAGWQVWNCIAPKMDEVARISAENWFGIIGFSVSLDTHFKALQGAIRRIRVESLNPLSASLSEGLPSTVTRSGRVIWAPMVRQKADRQRCCLPTSSWRRPPTAVRQLFHSGIAYRRERLTRF